MNEFATSTADALPPGSFKEIQVFLQQVMKVYPYRNRLTAPANTAIYKLVDHNDEPLWKEINNPMTISSSHLQLAPDEVICKNECICVCCLLSLVCGSVLMLLADFCF
jgi:hypothetical protein